MSRTVKWVSIDDLRPAKFNPKARTEERRLKTLKNSMMENGFVEEFPIIANENGTIADGHRRWTVAKELGMEKVPVLYMNGNGLTVDKVWAMNAISLAPTGKEVLEAHLLGMKELPEKNAKDIQTLEDAMGGKPKVRELYQQRTFSPTIFKKAHAVAEYCDFGNDIEFTVKLVRWFVKHQMQHTAYLAMHYGVSPESIVTAVLDDRPIKLEVTAS